MIDRIDTSPTDELEVAFENLESIRDNLVEFGVTPSVKALLLCDPTLKGTLEDLEDDKYVPAIEGIMDKIVEKFKSAFRSRGFTKKQYVERLGKYRDKIAAREEKGKLDKDEEITSVMLKDHVTNIKKAIKQFEYIIEMMKTVQKYKGEASDEEAVVMMTRLVHKGEQMLSNYSLPSPEKTTVGRAGFPAAMEEAYNASVGLMDAIDEHRDKASIEFRKLSQEMARLWVKHGCGKISHVIEVYIPNVLLSDTMNSFKSVVMET